MLEQITRQAFRCLFKSIWSQIQSIFMPVLLFYFRIMSLILLLLVTYNCCSSNNLFYSALSLFFLNRTLNMKNLLN